MMQVLVVENDPLCGELLSESLLEFGCQPHLVADAEEALATLREGQFRMVVANWDLPEIDGPELCRRIRRRSWSRYIYVILLADRPQLTRSAREETGADDFLVKPFQLAELEMRLGVGQRTLATESCQLTIFALAKLSESRDTDTGEHLERIQEYCRVLTEDLAEHSDYGRLIDAEYARLIYLTSPLHDIGKVGVPDSVLLKPGRLTGEEFETIKQHTLLGAATLQAVADVYPEAQFLAMARDIALTHHERFDGKGYPRGLAGETIPLSGRIVALADVYDALTSKRVYKDAFSHQKAHRLIVEGRGTQFDPVIVDAYVRCEEHFLAVQRRFASRPGLPLSHAPAIPLPAATV